MNRNRTRSIGVLAGLNRGRGVALKMKISTAKVGLAVFAMSTASFAVAGFGGSDASAANRTTHSKLCQQYRADVSKNNYTPQEKVNSYRKIAKIAPAGLKRELLRLAGELQAAINNGGLTKAQQQSAETLFNNIQSQLVKTCG